MVDLAAITGDPLELRHQRVRHHYFVEPMTGIEPACSAWEGGHTLYFDGDD
jgi:hypothetical protein